jgi:TolB-like protein
VPLSQSSLSTALGDRYRIERELGAGGMATVWLAHDLRHDRKVAVKVMRPELAAVIGAERFLAEIKTTANLQHPHILPLHDSGEAGGTVFYVMPFVEGESLRDRLTRERQLPIADAVRIAAEVASALDYAHRHGVVHRDIKPENILLDGERAMVADFGIATALAVAGGDRLTETGLSLGTPTYMSPEQATASRVDGRADVYSLGCVLYEMLAGEPPFTGASARAIMARHAVDPVPAIQTTRPGTPAHVEAALRRALAKVPADRYASAADFARAVTVPSLSPARVQRSPIRWFRISLAAVALVTILTVALVVRHRSPVAATPDRRVTAVLPFEVASADPRLAWLREGMVDLLTIKLTGDSTGRPAEPQAVLSAWERERHPGKDSLTSRQIRELARRLGAGRVVTGRIVGGSSRLVLSAALQPVDGRAPARATVEGPVDSLPVLVDRLAAHLLGLNAGVEQYHLASLATTSLPALHAFLAGRAHLRRGHLEEANRQLYEATQIDSTFALAGLELMQAAAWSGWEEGVSQGTRVARRGRTRLSPADQALLDVAEGQWSSGPDLFRKWQQVVTVYPDRPHLWYVLGDSYFHWGNLAGIDSALGHARQAFRRGWQLDSSMAFNSMAPERSPIFAEPLTHMVDLAQIAGDTAEVMRLVALGMAADTSGEQAHYLAWHRAVAGGDSARRAFWSSSRAPRGLAGRVVSFTQFTGIAAEDAVRALDEDARNATGDLAAFTRILRRGVALSAGRPAEARSLHGASPNPGADVLRARIGEALYWEGDSTLAVDAVRRLAPLAAGRPGQPEEQREQARNLCAITEWRLMRGEVEGATEAVERLEETASSEASTNPGFARYAQLCAAMLEALRVGTSANPFAHAKLDRLDSLARTNIFEVCCGDATKGVNLVIARLAEYQGDLPRALRAVRRRTGGFGLAPFYMSTFLAEEGRLAALVGDTAEAVRAYQHYLALRRHPEPTVLPAVEQVRTELEKLLAEHHP